MAFADLAALKLTPGLQLTKAGRHRPNAGRAYGRTAFKSSSDMQPTLLRTQLSGHGKGCQGNMHSPGNIAWNRRLLAESCSFEAEKAAEASMLERQTCSSADSRSPTWNHKYGRRCVSSPLGAVPIPASGESCSIPPLLYVTEDVIDNILQEDHQIVANSSWGWGSSQGHG